MSLCQDNHFHLALETPEANLSVGMQWLQATFSNRFNRFVRTQGHVFQGRYKSLVVDRDEYMGMLLDYIHLNPVRARIVSMEGPRLPLVQSVESISETVRFCLNDHHEIST